MWVARKAQTRANAASDALRVLGRQRSREVFAAFLGLALLVGCTGVLRPVSPSASEPGAASSATPEHAPTPSEASVEPVTPVPLQTHTSAAVPGASRTAEVTPSVASPPTVLPSPAPLSPTVTLPVPTAQVEPGSYVISDVVLFDGAHGRLYAHGRVGEESKTLVLNATSGGLLAAYDYSGALGLDAEHRWLYGDVGGSELVVLDADTGQTLGAVQLPAQESTRSLVVPPQADPGRSQVLAFRQNVVYIADPTSGKVVQTIPFQFEKSHDCRTDVGPYPIEWAGYDSPHRILYVSYLSYVCTPWYGYGIISYDVASGREITRGGDYAFNATATDGYLYGSSWHRFGIGYIWAWHNGTPWLRSSDWNSQPRFSVDAVRKRLYGVVGGSLGVFDPQTMDLLFAIPMPVEGQLAGFDSAADLLYFVAGGQLRVLPAGQIQEPVGAGLTATTAPTTSVDALLVSPTGPDDSTVFGIWGKTQPMDQCYAFAQQGGALLLSSDGGRGWAQPDAGLPACRYVSCLAVSPDYAHDQTLLAGLVGMGVFRSTDAGRLWRPASVGLGSMSVQELILSPGFAADRTAFVRVGTGGPFRSTDGGQTWQDVGLLAESPVEQLLLSPGFGRDRTLFARVGSGKLYRSRDAGLTWQDLGMALQPLALSPEFDQDGTILGAVPDGTDLYISRDAGSNWERLGNTPAAVPLRWLSMAPLFAKWGVAFAQSRDPIPGTGELGTTALYRTSDGGLSWRQVFLQSGEPLGIAPDAATQFVYAPGVEENRPVYLPAVQAGSSLPPTKQGVLYRSGDGGITWSVARLPPGIVPTAVALSPRFAADRLVFVGTADGRVLALRDDTL